MMTWPIKSRGFTGFTLVELSLVIAILGMIVVLCWPSLHGVSKRLIDAAEADRAMLKKRAAREQAAMTGQELPHES